MRGFLWNTGLALAWAAGTGEFTLQNLGIGFALGFVVLLIARRAVGTPDYGRKARAVVVLILFFIWELILANMRLAIDVLKPRQEHRPGVVAIPLDAKTDVEITLLANLITLTPGTLSVDVSGDRQVLYIHAFDASNVEELRRKTKQGFERRVLEVTR